MSKGTKEIKKMTDKERLEKLLKVVESKIEVLEAIEEYNTRQKNLVEAVIALYQASDYKVIQLLLTDDDFLELMYSRTLEHY